MSYEEVTKDLKEKIKNFYDELDFDRENNPNKETCVGCTFENDWHPMACECYRYSEYRKYKDEFRSKFKDHWQDINKYSPDNYFDCR